MKRDELECIDAEIGELLPFFSVGRLAADERRLVAAHLEACARCAREEAPMRDLAHGIAYLRARPHGAAAVDVTAARRRGRGGRTVFVAAALLAAAALAITLLPRRGPLGSAEVRALEARVERLEAQNAMLARTIAAERERAELSPLAGIMVAAPPNL